MKLLKNFYLTPRFFTGLLIFASLFVFAFIFKPIFPIVQLLLAAYFIVFILDILILFTQKNGLKITRNYPEKLSNGDENLFEILLKSKYKHKIFARILEEIPDIFQKRDFKYATTLFYNKEESIKYNLRPTKRGEYVFKNTNVLVRYIGLIERRFVLKEENILPCYPSFIQLRKYMLLATTNRLNEIGVKRIRRIGATLEFDTIRQYVVGDDYRFINWKATGKVRELMINQYEEEKSQPIYSFLDTGRSMRMPFDELTLLDYAINSTLVLSNVSISKDDKAGMLTFSKKTGNFIEAEKKNHQMQLISENLYRIKTEFPESEFGRLYTFTKRNISQRALIFLYTNFETLDAMRRQLPYLRMMNKSHIIVVVVFKNTELNNLAGKKAGKTLEIYNQIIAEKLLYEKKLIIRELKANNLQTIFTEPQSLTVNSINKYLEIKARGLI